MLGKPYTQEHYPNKGEGTLATAQSKERVKGPPHPRPRQDDRQQKLRGTLKSRGGQSRIQRLQAFLSAGQCEEDSGDINLIDFFDRLCLSQRNFPQENNNKKNMNDS